MNETMGQIIRRLRKEQNLTQDELAAQLNITYQAVSRWENGTGMPDISQIVPLSRVFGVSTDVLFGVYDTDVVAEKEKILEEFDHISEPRESYDFMMKVLEQYPGDKDFLRYALEEGSTVVYCRLTDDIPKVVAECERIARILINSSCDTFSIITAHESLATIYNALGQYERAKEHTDHLPNTIMQKSGSIREYHLLTKNYKQVKSCDSDMFFGLLKKMGSIMLDLGRDYYRDEQYENAETCLTAILDMIRALFGELPAYLPWIDEPVIGLAHTYLKMNHPEKALDILKLLPVLANQQKQIVIGNEISDHPLLKPAEYKYTNGYDTDILRRYCLDALFNKDFDPIREDVRFGEMMRKLEK